MSKMQQKETCLLLHDSTKLDHGRIKALYRALLQSAVFKLQMMWFCRVPFKPN